MALTPLQVALLIALALAGLAVLYLVARIRVGARRTGLPRGEIIYVDTRSFERGTSLRAPEYGLSGRPDYLVRQGQDVIPIEVKPGRRAAQPYDADVLQLAAYCLLVEATTNRRPPHGLLRYEERTFRIPFDDALRDTLLNTMERMRDDFAHSDVARSHDEPQRCRYCGHRSHCSQSLVPPE